MTTAYAKQNFPGSSHIGEVYEPDAIGRAGSLTCGAVLRITLRIDAQQGITEAKFKAAGCSFMLAACSLLCERIVGLKTAEAATEAQQYSLEGSSAFVEVPAVKQHCHNLVAEGLLSAIRSYSDARRAEWSGSDALICSCFGVSDEMIEREIRERHLSSIVGVTEACHAGAGCRSCLPLIEDILEELNRN